MGEVLKVMTESFLKFGFYKTFLNSNSIEGPLGILLAKNIRCEWFSSNVSNSDLNTFLYESRPNGLWIEDCQASYGHALRASNDQLPFALASVLTSPLSVSSEIDETPKTSSRGITNAYRRLIFINSKDSQQYFYRLQRQRKIWWRKFSTDPERFDIVEDKNHENQEGVQIIAKFPWTTEVVETICYHGSNPLEEHSNIFEAKVGRKKILPHVIESVCLESPAVKTYLCDAYHKLPTRILLRLNHRLAPYKAAVVVDSLAADDRSKEVNQLATFVSLSLRRAGLHTLNSTGNHSKVSADTLFSTHDSVGVPYSVVVTPSALTDGILFLRSRDTTLQEQVHLSKLVTYMQQLLK